MDRVRGTGRRPLPTLNRPGNSHILLSPPTTSFPLKARQSHNSRVGDRRARAHEMPKHDHRKRLHPWRLGWRTKKSEHRPRDAHKPKPTNSRRANIRARLDRGAPTGDHHGCPGSQGEDHSDLNSPTIEPGVPNL